MKINPIELWKKFDNNEKVNFILIIFITTATILLFILFKIGLINSTW